MRRVAHFFDYNHYFRYHIKVSVLTTKTNKKARIFDFELFLYFINLYFKDCHVVDYDPAGLVASKVGKGFISFGHLVSVLLFLDGVTFVIVGGN